MSSIPPSGSHSFGSNYYEMQFNNKPEHESSNIREDQGNSSSSTTEEVRTKKKRKLQEKIEGPVELRDSSSLSSVHYMYSTIYGFLSLTDKFKVQRVDRTLKREADRYWDKFVYENPYTFRSNLNAPFDTYKWGKIFSDVFLKIGLEIASMHQFKPSIEEKSLIIEKIWKEYGCILNLNQSMKACIEICLKPHLTPIINKKTQTREIKLKGKGRINKEAKALRDQLQIVKFDQKKPFLVNMENATQSMLLGIIEFDDFNDPLSGRKKYFNYPDVLIEKSIQKDAPSAAYFLQLYRPDLPSEKFEKFGVMASEHGDDNALKLFVKGFSMEELLRLNAEYPELEPVLTRISSCYQSEINEEHPDHSLTVFLHAISVNTKICNFVEADRILSIAFENMSDIYLIRHSDGIEVERFFEYAVHVKQSLGDEKSAHDIRLKSTFIMEQRKKTS